MRDLKVDELPQVYGAGSWSQPKSCNKKGGSTGKKGSHKHSTHKKSTKKHSTHKHT
jgi:hypothetical protein